MKTPCYGCEKRWERCHCTCEEYLEWKEAREYQKEAARLENVWRRGFYTERKRKK